MYQRILVPVEATVTSDAGLDEAIRMARLGGATLRLLHLVTELPFIGEAALYGSSPTEQSRLAVQGGADLLAACARRVSSAGVDVDTLLIEGSGQRLADVVSAQAVAWPADLVVLGTHGRHGIARAVLGSEAEQVVRRAAVPVLLVRHDPDDGAGSSVAKEAAAA
jgi:nucleotide-binding universal stress UspA family protein